MAVVCGGTDGCALKLAVRNWRFSTRSLRTKKRFAKEKSSWIDGPVAISAVDLADTAALSVLIDEPGSTAVFVGMAGIRRDGNRSEKGGKGDVENRGNGASADSTGAGVKETRVAGIVEGIGRGTRCFYSWGTWRFGRAGRGIPGGY